MKDGVFGWTGARLPLLGQGTWRMEHDERAETVRALRFGFDAGLTHVDTAELYGSGRVEEIVGEAIEGRRDEIFLVSKVMPTNASRKGTLAACERSLRRLGTDRLDLYLLHWPGSHPLADTLEAFEELVRAGKIRFFGVSNFDVADLERAVAITGPKRIACNQVLYHLEERTIEHRVIPWCEAHDVAVVGYSPFGAGDFPSPTSTGGRALAAVATRLGVTSRQVALAYLVRRPGVFAIPKAAHAQHVRDNAGAVDVTFDEAALAALEAAFPLGRAGTLPMI